ncbi:hypothetical protein GGS23DRAFT_385274 [Durotheca rogersii]|uniref:uncharacterized protein n=1 Tax=Durotheca rogersii TaxID=419775 RepID=UPI00221F4E1C|nr:uncharacterized protein GGS23DRAFT_385274 [Durotheca rogersii]KAI5866389.1 hypothetical protein GGS23DRAFT_385274 [Durotheca rogersii]
MAQEPLRVALNPLDHLPPPTYASGVLYLRLRGTSSFEKVFDFLREALHRTFVQLPWLGGKVHPVSTGTPGTLEIRHHPVHPDGPRPYQLRFNKLDCFETYTDLRESAFHPGIFEDEDLTYAPFLADLTNGTEVFIAQANFISGGCILTAALCHVVSDGMGLNQVCKIWAANCQDVQAGNALLVKPAPEISDHGILERIWAEARALRSEQQIPLKTWTLLGLDPPEGSRESTKTNGLRKNKRARTADTSSSRGYMKSYIFYMSPESVTTLRKECANEPGAGGVSVNDAISALVWRCLLKARVAARKALGAGTASGDNHHPGDGEDEEDMVLDLPFDGRSYFPDSVPSNYMGNFSLINRVRLQQSQLVAPSSSIGSVARAIRQIASEATSDAIMNAYTLVKTARERRAINLQNLNIDSNGLMITSLIALEITRCCFGDELFENDGYPEAMRTLMGTINKTFRYCVILPKKRHGGVEFVANLLDDEADLLLKDEEFERFAVFVA